MRFVIVASAARGRGMVARIGEPARGDEGDESARCVTSTVEGEVETPRPRPDDLRRKKEMMPGCSCDRLDLTEGENDARRLDLAAWRLLDRLRSRD